MKTYFKLTLILYYVALLCCGSLRVLMKLYDIDPVTGLYITGGLYKTIFNVLLGIAPVIMFLSSRLKRTDADYGINLRMRFISFFAIVVGISILCFALAGAPQSTLEQGRSQQFYEISSSINLILGLMAGLSFLYLGTSGVFGYFKKPFGLFVIIPSIWQVVLLITRFNSYTTVTTISDHLLAVLFMLFNSLFLIGHARTVCGHIRKDGRNYAIPSGLNASLCGFLLVIPNYVYMLANKSPMPVALLGMVESVYVLIMSFYALIFTIGLMRSVKKV